MKSTEAYDEAMRRIEDAHENDADSLDLGDLRLRELPEELGNLPELQSLTLGNRVFEEANWWDQGSRDEPLKFVFENVNIIKYLNNLTQLGLGGCQQITDLEFIQDMHHLTDLDIHGCSRISDLDPIRALSTLRAIDLSWCRLVDDLTPLANSKKLVMLGIGACRDISDFEILREFTEIRHLVISNTNITNLSSLSRMRMLRELDFINCDLLKDISDIVNLSGLRKLRFYSCERLRDYSHVFGIAKLQDVAFEDCKGLLEIRGVENLKNLRRLYLRKCEDLADVSGVEKIQNLEWLGIGDCKKVKRFSPIRGVLDHINKLALNGCDFDDLPAEVYAGSTGDTREKVLAHFTDINFGVQEDTELKLFVLGNGGVGKTQLCRRLRDEPFEPSIPSTHGVQLGQVAVVRKGSSNNVSLCCWDFGGQDIYHGTHALFIQKRAIFIVLWTPDLEDSKIVENGVTMHGRPLGYWLDYIRGLGGIESPVLVVQGHCDKAGQRRKPSAVTDDLPFVRTLEFSALTDYGLKKLQSNLAESVEFLLKSRPLAQIGVGRVKVRDAIWRMLKQGKRTLPHEEFRELCERTGKVSDPEQLLDFLHRSGVVFYKPGLFDDRIILDQTWALDAIYALLDRKGMVPFLARNGRFTRAQLSDLVWKSMASGEQEVVLSLMRSCGICFPVSSTAPNGDARQREYIAPDLLPEWSEAQATVLDKLQSEPADHETKLHYSFLHEGVLRTILSRIGEQAGEGAVYWKYGCWFCEEKTQSVLLMQSGFDSPTGHESGGEITLRAWGRKGRNLIDHVLKSLQKIPLGQPPTITHSKRRRPKAAVGSEKPSSVSSEKPFSLNGHTDDRLGIEGLKIVPRFRLLAQEKRRVFVSYAWGDETPTGKQREQVVDGLCEQMVAWGYDVVRDKDSLKSGDLISVFMQTIGAGDRVVVVLSQKYLRSVNCLTELHEIFRVSRCQKEDFLRRIIPLTLSDAAISNWRARAEHVSYWKKEHDEGKNVVAQGFVAPSDYGLWWRIGLWASDIGEILAHISDQLHPHGFDTISANNFAAVKELLDRKV